MKNDAGKTLKSGSTEELAQKVVNRKSAAAYKDLPKDADINETLNTLEAGPSKSNRSSHTTIYKDPSAHVPQYKKGGMVKRTGMGMLHKGEKVLTKSQTKKARMH